MGGDDDREAGEESSKLGQMKGVRQPAGTSDVQDWQ